MTNKDFWGQFEEAPTINIDDTLNSNDDYWKQFETAENNFDKELFNNKVDDYLNYDGAVIENRKPFTHKPIGNTSISNYNPKSKLYNPYDPIGKFLQGLKWVQELPSKAFEETSNQIEIADLEIKEMYNQMQGKDLDESDQKRLDYLNNNISKSVTETIEKPIYKHKDPWTVLGALERSPHGAKYAYASALKMLPFLYNMGKSGLKGGLAGAGIGAGSALAAGQLGPQVAAPEEIATVPAGAIFGFGIGAKSGAAKRSFEIETGLARNELKQINQEIINEGGTPLSNNEINGIAIGVGIVNAGLEFFSFKTMLKTVPGGNEILKKLEQKQLKELAKDKTIRGQLSKVFKNYSTAILTETSTETAQEITNIFADEVAKRMGGVNNTPLEHLIARVLNTSKEALAGITFLGGVGSVAQATKIYTLQGMDKQSARKKAENMSFDERHDFINNNQDILLNNIKNEPSVQALDNLTKKAEQTLQVSDRIFNDLKSANIDDEQANSLGKLLGAAYANIAEGDTKGRSALDIYDKYNVQIKGGISKDVISENAPKLDIQTEAFNQSAMYRSLKENFADFYNQVFEKEAESKSTGSKIQKSYYEYNKNGVYITIGHDLVNHDFNKHNIRPDDVISILNNIQNIENASISQKSYSNDEVALIKINTPSGKYGVAIQFANGKNSIGTVFRSTDKGIDDWIKRNSAKRATSQPLPSEGKNQDTPSVAILGQSSNNIITYVKENLKPNSSNNNSNMLEYNQGVFDNEQRQQQRRTNTTGMEANGSSNTTSIARLSKSYERRSYNGSRGWLVENTFSLPADIKKQLNADSIDTPDFHQLKSGDINMAQLFYKAIIKAKSFDSRNMASLHPYKVDEYKGMKLFLTDNQDCGFAIKSDGTLVSLFSYPRGKGRNKTMLTLAISQGATKLDCYDTYLPKLYKNFGFKEINRVAWDEQYKPDDWDKEYYSKYNKGEPDVIFMELQEGLKPEKNTYFQSVPPVGSSAFKEWFGDSKIVDESGRPLIVYHGTTASFNIFEAKNASADYDFPSGMYFSSSKEIAKTYGDYKHTKPMELYLKIENPLILEANGKTYNDFYDELYSSVKNIDKNKYDGIIIKNIRDDWSQNNNGGEIATTYIVFNPEQIKSVNNHGTFDINNPDIYYQPAYHGSPHKFNSFSLDKIGTGEGVQAHGWGLYFAENKEVSERYRKNLSGNIKILYKGEQYDIEENFGNALYKVKKYGKDKAIEFYKDKEKEFRTEAKISSNPSWWEYEANNFKIYADEIKNIDESNIEILEGQLFQVDIPEDNVLLDEDKIFKAQPETVKRAIKNIANEIIAEKNLDVLGEKLYRASSELRQTLKDNNYQETKQVYNLRLKYQNLQTQYDLLSIIQEKSKYYYSGKRIYETLSAYFNSDKKTSEELNKQGVKGIVYDGKIDGKCYVVFDDKAISVLETFYQDYIHNQITGEKVEIEINKDIKINEIKPQKISSKLPFEISKKPSDNKKALIRVLNLGNNKKNAVKNNNTNEVAIIKDKTVEKSLSNVRVNDAKYDDFCRILYNIEHLFKTSEFILQHKELKGAKNENIKRYANIAEVNNNAYLLEFVLKQNNEISLYSVNALKNEKRHRENASNKNSMQHDVANNSIANIQDVFKSKLINKYNNNVKKNGKNSNSYNPVSYEQEEHRGSISFFRDENGNIRKTLIDLVSGKADKSTAAHEFGHLFLQTLIIEADTNLKAREMLLEVNKWLGYNGKEYTTAQHEKFACGFEAYLASGKAPTYKLKQAFEKFKKWLKDIYLSIKYNTDIELSPEAEQVFNKIFGEENFEELNKKKADILKRAKEFGQTRYKPTEEQLRYKNIAYDILSTGLRRNPNWLKSVLESGSNTRAMQKKRERIEFDLRKIQDPYSSGSGMLPEWREFFTDPGISYENNIAGADYELAQQAYDVIINRTWERTNEEYYELQQAENEYEYLLKEFKKAKNTDDRTVILISYYDWLESIDEIVQEQYGERWVHDTNEIERFEQLNKFEQAKEILIKNSDLLKNSNGITEYKNVVQAVLKQLNFLTSFERNKILGVISEITSVDELKNNINEIMDFAETLQDVTARKNISENIQKELMATKNIRKNGKTHGRYDYSTNKLFNRLREVNRLNREDAEAEYTMLLEEFEAMNEEQKESLSFEDKLYKKFVTYKAHGNVYISSDFLSSLYQDIVFAKLQGKLSKNSADFENRINNNAAIDKVLDRLEKKRPANNITKFYTKFANLESFINLFLDKKFVDEYSLLYEETQVQSKSYLEKQSVLKEIANILNVKPFFIDDEIFKKLNEKYTFKDYSLKRPREIELNKMQLIEAYIYSKNPVIKQRLINMFGEGGYNRLMSLLNPDDIKIGDLLQRAAEKYYNPVNRIYIKKYGIDMPKAKNYFPVSADIVQELDLFNQYTEQSTAPKFFKTRTSSVLVPIKLSNPVQTLFTHIEKANNLILLEEKLGKLNRVFKDRTVKQFISDLYGEEAYNGFIKQISDCSYTKKAEMLGAVDGMINKLVNNTIVATISLKPKIMATQLVSVINFSEKMPSVLWFGGFLKALSNPKATIKFMMENKYLQQRFGEGAQNEALARIVKTSDFHKSKKFIDFFSLNVKLGDIGAIIFGGKPYVDYLMQHKKMSKEEAFKEFVLEVNRAQQAATTSSLADYQKSKNPIFRLYYAFQNTTNQYFRKTADAIISKANGDISNAEMAKTVLIYTIFNNFLYRMVANPYVWILGLAAGDWEDFAKEVVNSVFDFNSQAIIGIGNLYQAILNALLDKPFYLTAKGLDKIPFDVHKIISEAREGLENIKLDTWLNAMGDIIDTSTGAPASTIINAGSTPANITDGQIGTAILKILGYSDYQSKRAFDIED